ncbi:flavin-containing monooxygenase [Acidisoma sp. 7E03]
MTIEHVETLVIGAGQAGIAISEHLGQQGQSYLVVERHRIAERWRSERWDSLVANGPAWHDRFPNMTFPGIDPDAFPPKEQVAAYFAAYAEKIGAPVRTGVAVERLTRGPAGEGFRAETSAGVIGARQVVVATGPFQRPLIPTTVPAETGILQLHSSQYRNPDQLPEGAVLVVGAGSSGSQIADELNRAGRRVYLSVGPHHRPPRAYRGRDYCWWLGVLGEWDKEAREPGLEHVTIAVSGARGGETVDFRRFAEEGITLLGRGQAFADGQLHFAEDLGRNIAGGDANYLSVLDRADAYAAREGLDLPEEPEARQMRADPDCLIHPIHTLDLAASGITSIIWATGFALDFGWIDIDVFDAAGRPRHHKGVSEVPGLYFIGLPWLSSRGSSFIWGCWRDAAFLAQHIAARASAQTETV